MLTIPSTYLLAISYDIPRGQLARFIETHDARSQVSLMADPPSIAHEDDPIGGVDVKTAQVRLGHSDPRMTLGVYASAPASADRAAADVLGETFFGGPTDAQSH